MSYNVVVEQPRSTHQAIYMHCVCIARTTTAVVRHCLNHLDHGCTRTVTDADGNNIEQTLFIITPLGIKDGEKGPFQPDINEDDIQSQIEEALEERQSTNKIICKFGVRDHQTKRLQMLKEQQGQVVIGGNGCCFGPNDNVH